jgi:large subunit ribosomal protein L9
MLVILRENVENLGRIGDIVKVTDGYARNFLLPRNLVAVADENNKAQVEHQKKMLEKKRLAQKGAAQDLAKKLGEVSCTLTRKVGENDKLFGSVTANDIIESLKAQGYTAVEKRMILIESPIRSLGVHSVTVRLEPEVEATLKVWVAKES